MLAALISFTLVILSVLATIPAGVVLIEVLAALCLPARGASGPPVRNRHTRIAVLIPAHNESDALVPTIRDAQSQLLPGDRLLVISDNCGDDTAEVARNAGADVIQRQDLSKVGKGYALDFGVRALRVAPPEVVIIIDADCRLGPDAIDWLAFSCSSTQRPVQARYLMAAPENAGLNLKVAEFAWRLKNWLRPLGLCKLNLPCQLTGSGMAFPWKVLDEEARLDNGWLVEDMKLGIDLAIAGFPPVFCPSAICISEFASSRKGIQSQRQRWEHGHVQMILQIPRAFIKAFWPFKFAQLALIADLAVPPLSLLVILMGGMFVLTGIFRLFGFPATALFISAAGVAALSLAILLTWLKYGRDVLPLRNIGSILLYVAGKMPLYARIFSGRARHEWIRTDRGGSARKR